MTKTHLLQHRGAEIQIVLKELNLTVNVGYAYTQALSKQKEHKDKFYKREINFPIVHI